MCTELHDDSPEMGYMPHREPMVGYSSQVYQLCYGDANLGAGIRFLLLYPAGRSGLVLTVNFISYVNHDSRISKKANAS
jgi:hypothetical protein